MTFEPVLSNVDGLLGDLSFFASISITGFMTIVKGNDGSFFNISLDLACCILCNAGNERDEDQNGLTNDKKSKVSLHIQQLTCFRVINKHPTD